MQSGHFSAVASVIAMVFVSTVAARAGGGAAAAHPTNTMQHADLIKRGEYLVRTGLCNDCHTPHKLGPNGPEPDTTRLLSGHPSDLPVPPPPAAQGPWIWGGLGSMTAFWGPFGVSFTANLTPDKETGLGSWSEEMFIMALRTGRHEGKGRPILPPMPWKFIGSRSDEDLKAMFAYLQSIPAVRNKVPAPIDPPEEAGR